MSVERVASGTGLVNVYNFLAETFPERVDKTVHDGEENIIIIKSRANRGWSSEARESFTKTTILMKTILRICIAAAKYIE